LSSDAGTPAGLAASASGKGAATRVISIAAGLAAIPPLVDLASAARTTPFRYFAADAFYYFTVARNWVELGFPTFDRIHPTNGFHPLWQALIAAVFAGGGGVRSSEPALLAIVFLLGVALVTLSVVLLGVALTRLRGDLPWLYAMVPVGLLSLLMLPFWIGAGWLSLHNPFEGPLPLYGTAWSYMNGMESPLVLLAFAGLALAFPARAPGRFMPALALGSVAAGLTLARLDHGIIAAGVLLVPTLDAIRSGDRRQRAVMGVAWLTFTLPILFYCVYNVLAFGSALPVSGLAKSTFPIPHTGNLRMAASIVLKPLDDIWWPDGFYRTAHILAPAFGVMLLWLRKPGLREWVQRGRRGTRVGASPDGLELFLLGSGVGVLGLATYDLFFVRTMHTGHWYLPVSVLHLSLVVLALLDRHGPRRPRPRVGLVLACLVTISVFVGWHRRPDYHRRYIDFYFEEGPRVRAHYGADVPRIVEYDDGIVGFTTGFPTLSGFGLAADPEAVAALEHGSLLRLARDRGFDRAASLVYWNLGKASEGGPIPESEWRVVRDYEAEDGSFSIVAFEPRE